MERGYRPRDGRDTAGKPDVPRHAMDRHAGTKRLPSCQPLRQQAGPGPSAGQPEIASQEASAQPDFTAGKAPEQPDAANRPTDGIRTLAEWTNAPEMALALGAKPPVQKKAGATKHAEPAISGPLPAGERRISGALAVHQVSHLSTVITLGKSRITMDGTGKAGSAYSFYVEPGSGTGQRVVRVFATADIKVNEEHNPYAPEELICHRWTVRSPALAEARPRTLMGDEALDSSSDILTGLRLRDGNPVAVHLSLDGCRMDIRADEPGATFSYHIDEHWSGTSGLDRVVTVVATPGVSIDESAEPGADQSSAREVQAPGRRLVPRIIRVNKTDEVPVSNGAGRSMKRIRAGEYLGSRRHLGTNPLDPKSSLLETRGGQSVTVRESRTGAWMEIRPKDARIGGAFAYEIVRPPMDQGGATEIRALVGPGMIVEAFEPGPERPGGVADPGFAEMNVRMVLYRAEDPAAVPRQGTPLTEQLLQGRGLESKPDRVIRGKLGMGEQAALAAADVALGAVPAMGDVADLVELGLAAMTGHDRHGREVNRVDLAIMGVAVLLPFVGSGVVRGGRGLAKTADGMRSLAEVAAQFGRTEAEMEALLMLVSELTPQDARAVRRVEAALKAGQAPDADDVRHVRESLRHLGFSMDAPTGEVDIFPDTLPSSYDRMMWGKPRTEEDVGSTIEVGAVQAGASRVPRHHVLPQEHRTWFEERGFTGDNSIDKYCVELERSMHEAIHGGGNHKLARQEWPGEWNRMIMERLQQLEKGTRRKLTPEEILHEIREAMDIYDIDKPFVDYRRSQ